MKKRFLSLVAAFVFGIGLISLPAQAKTIKCEVESVKGSTVTMDCGDHASKLKAGQTVKVKVKKSRARVEGC